jgi:hypothetical protein
VPLIEQLMPSFDRHEIHETVVRAPRERVMRAVRDVTPAEIRFFLLRRRDLLLHHEPQHFDGRERSEQQRTSVHGVASQVGSAWSSMAARG